MKNSTMTQEQKDLLLKDICSRLPYGVKFRYKYIDNFFHEDYTTDRLEGVIPPYHIIYSTRGGEEYLNIEEVEVRPYLFPLSSMTEEQKKYVTDRWGINENFDFEIDPNWGKYFIKLGDVVDFINWCYENHLDINGLIPKGLSIDATGLNIY